ncbi:hypothetical protein [Cohnella cellulosilytica]|uniref:DUF1444 family protein n=1 Tax=Cohnella cellulosilytica TaxID=986710 RepID=A0ABW2FBY9_9BACL
MIARTFETKAELARFVLERAAELHPAIRFAPGEDELTHRYTYTDSSLSGTLFLQSLWHDYSRTGELNRVIDFLNAQFKAAEYVAQRSLNGSIGIDLFNIYPSLRAADFFKHQKDGEQMLKSADVPSMQTAFIENHISYYLFLTKQLIEPVLVYMNEEEIKQQAFVNLRKRGWNSVHMIMPSPTSNGHFQVFAKSDYPFQHQFFLPDLSQGHLPPNFLIAVPAQDMAIVYVAKNRMDTLELARAQAKHSGFLELVQMAYQHEPKPISNQIFWANGDRRLRLSLSKP